jgi:hypothetical protein
MGGSVPFEEALAARLSLFKPSLPQVQEFLETRPPKYVKYLILSNFFFALWVFQEFAQFYKNSSLLIISLDGKIGSAMCSFSISVVTKC